MTVQEVELITGKWYVVVKEGGEYRALSPAFDTYYEACHRGSGPSYPDDIEIRRWDGKGWVAVGR